MSYNDETLKGQSSGQRIVFSHAVSWAHDVVDLPVCHSLIHAVNFEAQNVLPGQTAAVAGQKRAERSLMGTWNLHASSHRLGYYIFTFLPRPMLLPRKMEFWSFQIWEKRIILSMLCWVQELSVHTHDTVCGSLWATSQSTRDMLHYETFGNFLWQTQWMVESFLSEAQQHPGMPCEAPKFSSQLPASFLEEVVPVGMHSLQTWKNNKKLVCTPQLPDYCQSSPLAPRTLSRIVKGNASGWLTVIPLRQEGYDLTSTQFRDQLAIRYGDEPSRLPSLCDGCGASFTLQHALDCPKGGLIKRGHNDIRDHDAKLADLAWGGVTVEPVLVPADDRNFRPVLQADWSARGVWEGNRVALFDNRNVDANAPSYQRSS